jgi:hypothetical protein
VVERELGGGLGYDNSVAYGFNARGDLNIDSVGGISLDVPSCEDGAATGNTLSRCFDDEGLLVLSDTDGKGGDLWGEEVVTLTDFGEKSSVRSSDSLRGRFLGDFSEFGASFLRGDCPVPGLGGLKTGSGFKGRILSRG